MLFQNGLRWLHAFPPISVGFARWHTENLPRPSHGRRSLTAEPDRQGSQKHASREAKPYCSRTQTRICVAGGAYSRGPSIETVKGGNNEGRICLRARVRIMLLKGQLCCCFGNMQQ